MPCHDPRGNPNYWEKRSDELTCELRVSEERLGKLDAVMCAVFNELESLGLINSIMEAAEAKSGYDAWQLWNDHLESDKLRLRQKLKDTFSATEQRLIKEILNDA